MTAKQDADLTSALHDATIRDQFSRQAEGFARSPALHNEAALTLLVDAARPEAEDETLDIACGPGTVVAAFARRVRRSTGLDATEAMLEQARELAARGGLDNVAWQLGDVYGLPFADASFDIVSCRFAFHHFERPTEAFAEMVRVCRPGGRVVLCDGLASDNSAKAAALNRMERHRDPSTVEFRPLGVLRRLFEAAGLPEPQATFYQVPAELERLIAGSFPAGGDRVLLRQMIEDSVDGDLMGMNARRDGGVVSLAYPSVILVSLVPSLTGRVARERR